MIIKNASSVYIQNNADFQILANNIDFFIGEFGTASFKEPYLITKNSMANNLYFIRKGDGYIGSAQMKPGYIYLIPNNGEHYQGIFNPGCQQIYIHFQLRLCGTDDLFSGIPEPIEIKDDNQLGRSIERLLEQPTAAKNIALKGIFLLSIYPFLSMVSEKLAISLENVKKYEFIFRYINNNLSFSLTTSEIAQRLGISYSHLRGTFVKETGFTIKKYIQQKLLDHTVNDIRFTDMRIKDIAIKYGFKSEYYFSDWFLRLYGQRPTQLREIYVHDLAFSHYKETKPGDFIRYSLYQD